MAVAVSGLQQSDFPNFVNFVHFLEAIATD